MISEVLISTARRSMKQLAIRAGLEFVAATGAGRFATSAAGRGVIFTLHHVRPERNFAFEPNRHLAVTPEFLDDALAVAREAGLHAVRLEDLPAVLSDPTDQRKLFCVTLDDGYRDNERYAAPVFRKHRVPYTIFVTPGFVERTTTIWWESAEALIRASASFPFDFGNGVETVQCALLGEKWIAFERLADFVQRVDEDQAVAAIERAAQACGVDGRRIVDDEIMTASELTRLAASDPLVGIGAHTLTHPNLKRVGPERLMRELRQSANAVAAYCGRLPGSLAYPYGGRNAVGAREASAARTCGFAVAVTTQPGVLGAASLERLTALPRVSLNGYYQKKRYVRALVSGLPFKLLA